MPSEMGKNEIFSILKDWNAWATQPEAGIPRPQYLLRLHRLISGSRHVMVVTGARRAGKSFLMKQVGNAENIFPRDSGTVIDASWRYPHKRFPARSKHQLFTAGRQRIDRGWLFSQLDRKQQNEDRRSDCPRKAKKKQGWGERWIEIHDGD